jgi:2,4-dienoyl-CoA reductase-like NADH-dependent reductase (Old Yellow Enzyme family)
VTTPFDRWALGPLTLRNRLTKTATFEGMTAGGRVTDALIDLHAGLARGGIALTTVAYGAVSEGGRTFGEQLLVDDGAIDGLSRLADAVHAGGGAVSLQLSHCGGFRRLKDGLGARGPSAGWNAYGLLQGVPRVAAMDDRDLDGVVDAFAAAARRCERAGFDAVEVHAGHGYLLSQFLSPALNHRRDDYGGALANRARLAERVVAAVRDAVGGRLAITVKTNLEDGVRGGLGVDEAVEVATRLVAAGADGVLPSCGLVQRSPFFLLRGRAPVREMVEAEPSVLQKVALRAAEPILLGSPPYRSTFLLDGALRVRAAVTAPVGLLGGVDGAAAIHRALDHGFDFVAMGRALIADPDLVRRLEQGEAVESRCDHCNACVAEIERGPVRCVLPPRSA